MAHFTEDFLTFFKELAPNNNKDWMDENRKRYVKSVKEPFQNFTADLIDTMKKHDPKINVLPKDCIFRINRDVRFSKNKEPYKIKMSAIVSRGGKKDKTTPGMYVEITPEWVRLYMGVFMMDKEQLMNLRTGIANNIPKVQKFIQDTGFKKTFGEVRGEKNVRIDKSLKEAAEKEPLIFNKNFYFFHQMNAEEALKDNFVMRLEKAYLIGKPLSDFIASNL